MTIQIPITLLATDPVEAAGKLIDRDVKPMYEAVCTTLEQVVQANFRASSSTLRVPRAVIAAGRVWFGSEQYLLNYAEALSQRLPAVGASGTILRHAVTVPAPLQEKTNKPPNWLMVRDIRDAHISRLMRYDDFMRLDARLEYLIQQREAGQGDTTPDGRRRHNGGSFLVIMQRQRQAQRRPDRSVEPLIVYALSHLGIDARRGDYFQADLRAMRTFIRSLDCYSQSPSAFFRRNNYAGITGMTYQSYYAMILKIGVYSVSDARYTILMRARQAELRAQADASVSPFTDSVRATPRPTAERTPYRDRVRVNRSPISPANEEIARQYVQDANGQSYYMDLTFNQDRPAATFWIAPDSDNPNPRRPRG